MVQESGAQAGANGPSILAGELARIYRRGKKFYLNIQVEGRQVRKSLRTSKLTEARLRAARIESQVLLGQWRSNRPEPLLAEIVAAYLQFKEPTVTEGTLDNYRLKVDRLQVFAGDRGLKRLSQMDLTFVDVFRPWLSTFLTEDSTVHGDLIQLKMLIRFAISRGLIPNHPLSSWSPKKPKHKTQPCWTPEEVDRILLAAPDDWRSIFTLLAETGMRIGELCWLTQDDIDLAGNQIHIRAKAGWKPKTGNERRIALSSKARGVLKSLPKAYHWVVTKPITANMRTLGVQLTPKRTLDVIKKILKRLGLRGHTHTFRHSFISNALIRGTPPAVLREWVGHFDEATTRVYTHVHREASQAAMRQLEEKNKKSKGA